VCQAFVAQQSDMSGTRAAGKHQVIRYNGAGYPTGDLL
jgi:hypothetical protein